MILNEQFQNSRIIKESTATGKNWYVEGVMIQSDVMNRNKRIYPLSVMQESVEAFKRNYLDNDQAVGESGHPACGRLDIDFDCVSHKIISIEQEGKNFIGKALILNTPKGKVIQNLLEGGVKIGMSTRGAGGTKQIPGGESVLPGFKIFAVDAVFNPSAQTAYMDALMEGEKMIWDANDADTVYLESIRESIKNTSARMLTEQTAKAFADLVNRLKA